MSLRALFQPLASSISLPRIRKRRTLIVCALLVQAVVLALGWLVTFRIVRDRFAQVVEDKIIEQNVELAERVAQLLPDDLPDMLEFGSPEWDKVQGVIENLTDLPADGFACVIQPDGSIICHPDVRHDQSLLRVNLGDKALRTPGDHGAADRVIVSEAGMETASGRIEFAADGVHYVATRKLPGSDLRLLVHQPQAGLLTAGEETTRAVALSAGLAAIVVLTVSGLGLTWVLRGYDSFVAEVNRRMRDNLKLARTIQRSTLPESLPQVRGFQMAAYSEAAEETGGDAYDVVPMTRDDMHIRASRTGEPTHAAAMLIADATGHGVGPAISVSQLRAMFRVALRLGASLLDTASHLNTQAAQDLPDGRFITAAMAVVHREGLVRWFSAGQGPLLLYHAATGEVESLAPQAWPLGVDADLPTDVGLGEILMKPGDILLLATDGIYEAPLDDTGRSRLGEAPVIDLLRDGADRDAEELLGQVRELVADTPPEDDRTVIVLKRTG
ncbi:MAG: PP2C family protein-serine/threonine phosphatase [Planctomycetota bacterium]